MNKSDFEFAKASIAEVLRKDIQESERIEKFVADFYSKFRYNTLDQITNQTEVKRRVALNTIILASLCESIAKCDK